MTSDTLFSAQLIDTCARAYASRSRLDALGAIAFQRRQALRRAAAARAGRTVPAVLIASITRRCNLDCVGCYAKELRPELPHGPSELSDDSFMEIFEEAVELGVGVLMVAGGEPFLRGALLERLSALRGPLVPVFTNGTLIEGSGGSFGPSLVPVFSVEGDSLLTSERRGPGVHEAALGAARSLRASGRPFGLSVTVTSRNAGYVLSAPFMAEVAAIGPSALFLVEFVPAAPGSEHLALDGAQRARLSSRALQAPCPLVRMPGDEKAYGGCLAAGRGFLHLSPEGRVEACPFAPYSDADAGRVGLAAALDSPLMAAIRDRHGELVEAEGGCALRGKAGWIASLSSCSSVGAA